VTAADRTKELDSIAREGSLIAGKYRVENVLGHGGMGGVVAATHRRLGQRVAIKILYPSSARNPEAVARFLREAQAAAALQSEHVVRILDFGRHGDGLPFMVMEHLQGTNLADLLASRGTLPVDEAIHYLMQASEAVAEAHARGIVHRDIKPANLFLTARADGSPLIKVLDFGISKAEWLLGIAGYNPDLTATADTLGTPMYMSPEQVRSTKSVTVRTDIWALGVVLYEFLAGVPPFWADSLPALSAKIVADPATPLNQRRNDLPAGLDAVVLGCLEKDPDRRPASILELARALSPLAPAVTQGWVARVERIVQQATLPYQTGGLKPALLEEEPHAWGRTQSFRRNLRGGLLGLAMGASVALVLGGVWLLVRAWTTNDPPTASVSDPRPSATAAAASSSATDTNPDGGPDAGNGGPSPATVSSSSSSAPAPRRTGAPRSDPLGDRY
jgi:serine/threonine-protein kinase